jgi:arylsulfatase
VRPSGSSLRGAALGHPTPNIDRIAKEGAMFTSWYGQASCTAGRASFITGRIPIRSALSIVVAPGDENYLRKETPTIAEFFKKSGYSTYFSGKWHLGDKPESYPIEHGFDPLVPSLVPLEAGWRVPGLMWPGRTTAGCCRWSTPC